MILDNPNLQFQNPWWDAPDLIKQDKKLLEFERMAFRYVHPLFSSFPREDTILTIRGPRQIGKTTLVKLIIRKLLLEDLVNPVNVCYYSCDSVAGFKELLDILSPYLAAVRAENRGRVYVFLDEISFVSEWQRALKLLADDGRFDGVTAVLTGSNVLDLAYSSERLPGRRGRIFRPDIDFLPLDFSSFVALVKPDLAALSIASKMRRIAELNKLFSEYLLTGGFPSTINEYYREGFISSTTYVIFVKWIEGDVHKAGRSEETANQLVKRIHVHLGSTCSFYSLAKEVLLASHVSASEYVDLLRRMFVVVRLPQFNLDHMRQEAKRNGKLYVVDPFIYSAIMSQVEGLLPDAFDYAKKALMVSSRYPELVEQAVVGNLARRFERAYWGEWQGNEVDLVGFTKGMYHPGLFTPDPIRSMLKERFR